MNKSKFLILVEGKRIDARLMERLLKLYNLDAKYEIVSYETNIYVLYNKMFLDCNPADMDILQVLKEREVDTAKKQIFDQKFTDILLVFDLDPQDPQFTEEKISLLANHFVESTDMGKLYLNYPMVEAFYHMTSIPDCEFNERAVTLSELKNKTYKTRVNAESLNRDYAKFAITREECNTVIKQNIEKGWHILSSVPNELPPESGLILDKQLESLRDCEKVYVLCTCAFFISEYNPTFLN